MPPQPQSDDLLSSTSNMDAGARHMEHPVPPQPQSKRLAGARHMEHPIPPQPHSKRLASDLMRRHLRSVLVKPDANAAAAGREVTGSIGGATFVNETLTAEPARKMKAIMIPD